MALAIAPVAVVSLFFRALVTHDTYRLICNG